MYTWVAERTSFFERVVLISLLGGALRVLQLEIGAPVLEDAPGGRTGADLLLLFCFFEESSFKFEGFEKTALAAFFSKIFIEASEM